MKMEFEVGDFTNRDDVSYCRCDRRTCRLRKDCEAALADLSEQPKQPATRGMKDGQSCYMIERRDHPTLKPHAWLFFDPYKEDGGMWDWTQDPNKALHFADMASCDQIANEMPDSWDISITDHQWMDHSNGRES